MPKSFFLVALVVVSAGCNPFNQEQITTLSCYEGQPAFSPNGDVMAFVTTQTGDRHIWLYDLGERITIPVTVNEGVDEHPSFAPDGERIIFTSRLNGQNDLWIVSPNDELIQVTKTDSVDEIFPVYSPDGMYIWYIAISKSAADGGYAIHRTEARNFSKSEVIYRSRGPLEKITIAKDKIVFGEKNEASWVLMRLDPATGSVARWSDGYRDARHAALSPDGKHLFFSSDTNGYAQIFFTRADTFNPVLISGESKHLDFPAWTPDGHAMAYQAETSYDIRRIEVKTQMEQMLIETNGDDRSPVMLADGKTLLYVSNAEGRYALYARNLSANKAIRIAYWPDADVTECDLRNDGTAAVVSVVRGGLSTLYEMPITQANLIEEYAAGKSAYALFQDSVHRYAAHYAIDGKAITYVSLKGGSPDIWVYDTATKKEKQLTIDMRTEANPVFSNDGAYIYFDADWAGRWSIWRVPVSGGMPSPVTRDKTPYGSDREPSWSPDGQWLAITRTWYDDADIWLYKTDEGEKTSRTLSKDNNHQERRGRWTHDGKYMIYESGGNTDIWMQSVAKLLEATK